MLTNIIKTIDGHNKDALAYDYLGELHTYAELKEKSDQLAAYLIEQNLPEKAAIMVYGGHEFEMMVAFLASVKSGHAYIPVDVNSSNDRIEGIVEVAKPAALIAVNELPIEIDVPVIKLDENIFTGSVELDESLQVTGDDTYYIIFTSGTTGKPKGVQISHDNLLSFTNWMLEDFNLKKEPVTLAQPPYSFDLSVMEWAPTLALGGCLKALPKEVADDFAQLFTVLPKMDLEVWVSTPSFSEVAMLSPEFNQENYPELKHFLFCGEELTVGTAKKLKERFPEAQIFNTYGPTEATVAVTRVEITNDLIESSDRLPIGYVKPNTTIHIVDGEIVIAGPSVSKGYMNNPEKTAEAFYEVDGEPAYRTGDLGKFDENGLLHYGGRKDFQIKLHGYRIELEEVNHFLNLSKYVKSAVAVPKYGADHKVQAMVAYVVPKEHEFEKNIQLTNAIKAELNEIMMPYMVPSRFKYVDSLPISPNGKIDIKAVIAEVNK
ncbi:D-alanine--poly(phosphoribitol) ligase subunit 1 [Floricoccus penangensis]|uniref:D-alanine--D-alanyl carrier protein ligase n=1 Tax=Floricoccus penangensis TaxID=1859475 RepID=A0A9Q5JIQ6_9LACT|nr:D-alanine--poly(phosphoribitol) ligase subunit DltA [Floricoccus penangensis]OFI47999.1 D-alanine--poly(phosphoribitol) ligase subunit 1 [Floricoccus penangensis]